jgi:hypothetical protein
MVEVVIKILSYNVPDLLRFLIWKHVDHYLIEMLSHNAPYLLEFLNWQHTNDCLIKFFIYHDALDS